ncbi:membrane metallo-endopeptidase-like 1 isoform X3 [Leptotrombidium deliense]|uniref:Membrane metallo-endopeptidase-like 1 isoform X3 n=1 Tax=Leptotrombidium deliense TaxID=299467 RepID=A0A443SQD8_9ACAR|nr:membrane metallo-endopeptidase-like 1 isoform X3 [Leptotrombidium deliense]
MPRKLLNINKNYVNIRKFCSKKIKYSGNLFHFNAFGHKILIFCKICYFVAEKRIKESLNEKIDPCDDFYGFACGNWLSKNPLPVDKMRWSPLDILELQIKYQMKSVFEKKRKERPKFEKFTYKLYEDCLRQNSIHANVSSAALRRLLKKFGGWPLIQKRWKFNFSFERVYGYIRSSFGVNWILGVYLYTETERNALRTLLYLDAPSFVVERKLLYSPIFDNRLDSMNAYKKYIKSVALLLKEDTVDEKQLNADIDAMIEFEASLMKSASDQRSKISKSIRLKNLPTLYPKIRWSLLIREMSAITNVTLTPETEILVNDDRYYTKLSAILHSTSKR